jgi:hypothetical protein
MCPPLAEVLNGMQLTSNGRWFPSTSSFACKDGFQLTPSSSTTLTCKAQGLTVFWDIAEPVCKGMRLLGVDRSVHRTALITTTRSFARLQLWHARP